MKVLKNAPINVKYKTMKDVVFSNAKDGAKVAENTLDNNDYLILGYIS